MAQGRFVIDIPPDMPASSVRPIHPIDQRLHAVGLGRFSVDRVLPQISVRMASDHIVRTVRELSYAQLRANNYQPATDTAVAQEPVMESPAPSAGLFGVEDVSTARAQPTTRQLNQLPSRKDRGLKELKKTMSPRQAKKANKEARRLIKGYHEFIKDIP